MRKLLAILGLALVFVVLTGQQIQRPSEKQHLVHKNLLINPGAEQGTGGYSETGDGVLTFESGAGDFGSGTHAIGYDANTAADFFSATAITMSTVPGLHKRSCIAEVLLKGATAGNTDYSLVISDGTNNLASVTISTTTNFERYTATFICPNSGTMEFRIVSAAGTGTKIFLDEFYLGENFRVGDVSQATLVGTLTMNGNAACTFSTTSATFARE